MLLRLGGMGGAVGLDLEKALALAHAGGVHPVAAARLLPALDLGCQEGLADLREQDEKAREKAGGGEGEIGG